jgi:hypothetical protein
MTKAGGALLQSPAPAAKTKQGGTMKYWDLFWLVNIAYQRKIITREEYVRHYAIIQQFYEYANG